MRRPAARLGFAHALAGSCAAGFVALTIATLAGTPQAGLDRALAGAVQSLRSPALDGSMVALTLLGDTRFVLVAMALVIVALLATGHRRPAVGSLAIFAVAKLGGPLVKILVARPRPSAGLAEGPASFSFPSGHAAGAGVLLGTVALVVVAAHPRAARIVLPVAAALACGVAASRVWLNVHWSSDVLAGLLLAAALVAALAIGARMREAGIGADTTVPMLAGLVLLYAGYAWTTHAAAVAKYERMVPGTPAALAAPRDVPTASSASPRAMRSVRSGQAEASDLPSGMRIFWPG